MSESNKCKCPKCGGSITFSAKSQTLVCPYCGTETEVESAIEFEKIKEEDDNNNFNWEEADLTYLLNNEGSELERYICENCGGEVIGDSSMASSVCPFCSSNIVISKQFEGMLKPQYIVPFQLGEDQARDCLVEYFKGKVLLPKKFKEKGNLEKLYGMYVPYWLFDCTADGGIRYKGWKTRTRKEGNYRYTTRSYYSLYRAGEMEFSKIPVDASVKLENSALEALEPYDFSRLLDFNTAYLMGFLTDRFEVNPNFCKERANERVKNSLIDELSKTVVGYTSARIENIHLSFSNSKISYALLPIYIFHISYLGKDYRFLMNGQTGKIIGNLPRDNFKFVLITIVAFVCLFCVFGIINYFCV